MTSNATIIGDGAMGTVCGLILASNGFRVTIWSAFPEQAAEFAAAGENTRFLPSHRFPDNLQITADTDEALRDSQLMVSAVPCQYTRSVWERIKHAVPDGVLTVSVTKGVENETLKLPTQIILELGGPRPIAALSGPSIGPEVARGLPAAVVAAADDEAVARTVQEAFNTDTFRVYTNTDLIGVEVAGAAKNVIALAAGAVDGLNAGDNAKAALLTRGIVEIARLGQAMGARPETFRGLAGMGDLVTTCISPVSRNRTAGEKIGRGIPVQEVIESTPSVIEGIATTHSIVQMARSQNVEMPITEAVYAVLYQNVKPADAIAQLMTRALKAE